MWSKKYVSDDDIIAAVKNTETMSQAAALVQLRFSTFKRRALTLNIYVPNQSRAGIKRSVEERNKISKYKLADILKGLHPEIDGNRVKQKLFFHGIKINKCEECGIDEWNNKKIMCEMHHIDGDRTNHKLKNLQILCPNCHSQTDNFCNVKRKIINAHVV